MPTPTRSETLSRRELWLVQQLSHRAGSSRKLRVELGILGPSDRDGYTRLYRGPDPRDFLEIRESDIKHRQSLETTSNPAGGTILWLSSRANVRNVRGHTADSHADFLQGPLADTFLPGTTVTGVPTGGAAVPAIFTAFTSVPCAIATIGIIIYTAIEECGTHTDPDDDDDDDDDDGGEID